MEALCHDTKATTPVLPRCALPMAHLQIARDIGLCPCHNHLGIAALVCRHLETELLPQVVSSGGRYVNMYR